MVRSADAKTRLPDPAYALPGRQDVMPISNLHYVSGHPLVPPFPEFYRTVIFGMGCFWGAERFFWAEPGVFSTHVGYAGGHTPNATYQEVCTGLTGHAETVRIVFDPEVTGLRQLLRVFWENHDPTQGMQQGNDLGTQYRSCILVASRTDLELAERSRDAFQAQLSKAGMGRITTEIRRSSEFYYAEDYHQQYLAKNPAGYCGLVETGVTLPGFDSVSRIKQ